MVVAAFLCCALAALCLVLSWILPERVALEVAFAGLVCCALGAALIVLDAL